MATSVPVLDPPTLPQTAFATADEALNRAAQLRARAEVLKAKATRNEEYAAKIQANAEEDREYVQAELDNTLEYHGDVLEHFLLMPENKKEVERLSNSVEEGRAHVHEVITLGEELIQFRAADLGPSQQIERNHSTKAPTSGNFAASSFRSPFSSYASHAAPFATIAGQSTWRGRINNLLGNRLSGTFRQVLTDPNTPNEEDETEDTVSSDVLQQAVLPPSDVPLALGLEAEGRANRHEEKEKGADVDTVPSVQVDAEVHEVEDEISLEPPPANAQTTEQLNHSAPSLDFTILEAQRLKRSDITEEENAVWNEEKTLAMYRELRKDQGGKFEHGKKRATQKVKAEMKWQIESNGQIPQEKKKALIGYWQKQIREIVKGENWRFFLSRQPANEVKRKGSASALQPASKKRKRGMDKAAWLSKVDLLAKYRNAFAMAGGDDGHRRNEARMVIRKELSDLIKADDRIPGPSKPKFDAFVNHEINVLDSKEIKTAAQKNQDDTQLAAMPANSAGYTVAEEEAEGYSGQSAGIDRDYFSEESVDDSQYP